MLTASGDDLTASDDPFKKAMRQIAGAFAELEEACLEGQAQARSHSPRAGPLRGAQAACAGEPRGCGACKAVAVGHLKTGSRLSLRQISVKMAEAGFVNEHGRSYNPASIKSMLDGVKPASDGSRPLNPALP